MSIPPIKTGQPSFGGYNWRVKKLFDQGKLPTVKKDISGRKLTRGNRTVDHVVPKSKGGKVTDENAMIATAEFNSLRGNRDIRDFITAEKFALWAEQYMDINVDGFNGAKYVKGIINTIWGKKKGG